MTPQQAERFARLLGATRFDRSSMPWLTFPCPMARWRHQSGRDSNPSFGILTGKARTKCHCFSCNFSGRPEDVVAEMRLQAGAAKEALDLDYRAIDAALEESAPGVMLLEEAEAEVDPTPTPLPESFWGLFPPVPGIPSAMKYLTDPKKEGRGLTPAEVVEYGFRFDPTRRRACVAVRGFDGRLYGVRGRAVDRTNPLPWLGYVEKEIYNPQVWYGEHELDLELPVIVAESVFDRIAIRRHYRNCAAPLSASISRMQVDRMSDVFLFVHLFDPDKAGRRASNTLMQMQPGAKHVVLNLPEGVDPDEMPPAELREIISSVLPVCS